MEITDESLGLAKTRPKAKPAKGPMPPRMHGRANGQKELPLLARWLAKTKTRLH